MHIKGVKALDQQAVATILSQVIPSLHIRMNESMKLHTSFKIGGPADLFVIPQSVEQLMFALEVCKKEQIPFYIMGNGSNLLVRDKGFRGMIIQVYKDMSSVKIEGETIWTQAGILLSTLSNKALAAELTGLEFASGIPGTVGGAVYMNAGAYDGEMKQVIRSAQVLDENGTMYTLSNEELELGYRTSKVQKQKYIVLSVELQLQRGSYEEIKAKMEDLTYKRTSKQPLEMPSAGSTFKRPTGHFAGKLIMDAELQGYRIGGAQVSEKHCGFVVNTGEATAQDVLDLISYIRDTVWQKFTVSIEPEVRIIGEE